MKIGLRIPKKQRFMRTMQTGLSKKIAGFPSEIKSERCNPFSPRGPRISARTMIQRIRIASESFAIFAKPLQPAIRLQVQNPSKSNEKLQEIVIANAIKIVNHYHIIKVSC